MPIERIYIARHGFRLNWQSNIWTSPTGLARDIPLTSYGEQQAVILAQHILSLPEDERPTAIFSSAWYRCIQTSIPVAEALGVPIYIDQGMGEWFSPAAQGTGLHPRPPTNTSLLPSFFPPSQQHLINTSYANTWVPSRHGESVSGIHSRCYGFLSSWLERMGMAEKGDPLEGDIELHKSGGSGKPLGEHKNVLMVAHAASVIALVRVLTGERDMPLRVGCCSLSLLVPSSNFSATSSSSPGSDSPSSSKSGKGSILGNAPPGSWELTIPADASFLPNGSERDWGFEDIEVSQGQVVEDHGEGGKHADRSGHELETTGEGGDIKVDEEEAKGGIGREVGRWFGDAARGRIEEDVRRYEEEFIKWGIEKGAKGVADNSSKL